MTSKVKSASGGESSVVVKTALRTTLPASSATSKEVSSHCRVMGISSGSGVPVSVPDHAPSPAELTARTCISYSVVFVRLEMTYRRSPLLQALSRTVQLDSTVSSSLVSM